ncbi:MAG: Hpt domain-containing protein [Phycisphaera sp. RhM]|nr:Hpt domain-containing protein [Phycisphaera sp. RhM]
MHATAHVRRPLLHVDCDSAAFYSADLESAPPPQQNHADMNYPFDTRSLMSRCLGNVEFAESLLDEFASGASEKIDQLRSHADSRNAIALTQTAHSLKGVASILCADSVQDLAARIESAGRSMDWKDIPADVDEIIYEVQECIHCLPRVRVKLRLEHERE